VMGFYLGGIYWERTVYIAGICLIGFVGYSCKLRIVTNPSSGLSSDLTLNLFVNFGG
jgi:hypothetical protein